MKILGNERKVVVKFIHLARIPKAFLWCNAMLHAAMILACEVSGLAIASGVKPFDAAVIYNHDHSAG